MNKTSWIFYFMCNQQIINRIINIKYHSCDEVIENIYISTSISHLYLQKPEFTPYIYWLIAF